MIYFLKRDDGAIKIGTTMNFHMRLSQLIEQHGDLELLGVMAGGRDLEQWLHKQFGETRIYGNQEWFYSSDKLMKFIRDKATPELPPKQPPPASIRVHPTNRAVLDYIAAMHVAQTGQNISIDEALWIAFTKGAPAAVAAVLALGAEPPVDKRKAQQ